MHPILATFCGMKTFLKLCLPRLVLIFQPFLLYIQHQRIVAIEDLFPTSLNTTKGFNLVPLAITVKHTINVALPCPVVKIGTDCDPV